MSPFDCRPKKVDFFSTSVWPALNCIRIDVRFFWRYLSIDKSQGERGGVFLVGSRDQFPTSDALEETSDKVEVTVPRGQVEEGVAVSLVQPAEVFLA